MNAFLYALAASFLLLSPAQATPAAPVASNTSAAAPVLSPAASARHGITLYGELKYGPHFTHFEYVNPDAPKGGTVKLAETGNFDTVNAFILNGVKAPGLAQIFDSLMVQSQDEPQSMYGLVAESVVLAP